MTERFLPCSDHEPVVLDDGKVLATCRCHPASCQTCGFDFAAAGLPHCTVCAGAKRLLGSAVRCEVPVPSLREWAEADHPPSLLTWHREFVPALRSLLDLLDAAEGYASTVRRWQDDPMLASDLLDAESVLCNAAIQASHSGSIPISSERR
jgi:hypothetical protein